MEEGCPVFCALCKFLFPLPKLALLIPSPQCPNEHSQNDQPSLTFRGVIESSYRRKWGMYLMAK